MPDGPSEWTFLQLATIAAWCLAAVVASYVPWWPATANFRKFIALMARTTNFDENFYSFQHTIEARDFIENIFQLKEIFEFGPHSQKQNLSLIMKWYLQTKIADILIYKEIDEYLIPIAFCTSFASL